MLGFDSRAFHGVRLQAAAGRALLNYILPHYQQWGNGNRACAYFGAQTGSSVFKLSLAMWGSDGSEFKRGKEKSEENTSVHTKLTADIRTQHACIFLGCKFSISGKALQSAAFKMLPLYLDIHMGCSEEL